MRTSLVSPEQCRQLLLAMARQRSTPDILHELVTGLVDHCGAALARVWLVIPKPQCGRCPAPDRCESHENCLRLSASAGRSVDGTDWSGLEGRFSRIPFGFGKVGHIAQTREPVEDRKVSARSPWIADSEWVRREGIKGVIGQPMIHHDQLLGVLAVFTRQSPSEDDLAWLRAFADDAASRIANNDAFARIRELRDQLASENEYLRDEVKASHQAGDLVGDSPVMRNLESRIRLVARTDATTLIQGESGTGKELVARAIHQQSLRASHPLITVNCAAIPAELFESEFFGHVAGAFSGAIQDRAGRIQLAEQGTLFLDEIGEIPLPMQAKLLRVLEQGTYERVGEGRTRKGDVRFIAATNRDLEEEARRGRFRKDLYYRLSVFQIDVPPLRERSEDVLLLARHFAEFYSRKYRLAAPRLSRDQAALLQAYEWPGNVRELRNVMERAVIAHQTVDAARGLDFSHLKERGRKSFPKIEQPAPPRLMTEAEMRMLERENLVAVLKTTRWKVSGPGSAAEFLGLNPATLASRLRSLGIVRSQEEQSHE